MGGLHFREVCEMAGRNPQYVREKARKLILRSNGWNVDVPITSHYRQGPKRGRKKYRKKHLTGNSYYAAKGKKNFYYQDYGYEKEDALEFITGLNNERINSTT